MATKPNVVLIVADDMGYGDFGTFNDGYVRTPALDQLIDESLCLTQHYSASPVCSPARAGLLTGRHPLRTGVLGPQEVLGLDRIALDELTLADGFRSAGYATGLVGKWHNGALDSRYHPNARGFQEFAGFAGGWADYFDWRLDYNGTPRQSDGRYVTDVFTDEGISFIRRHRSEPFLLCMMYSAPHSPMQAPDEIVQPYLDAGLSPVVALTYAMIEVMDTGVARLRDELASLGLADNTILMFSSDNGPAFNLRPDQVPEGMSNDATRYNCGYNGAKGSVYEGGIRVPMVMHWPDGGLGSKRASDAVVDFTDWFPTLTSLTGIEIPDHLPFDGHDVSAALTDQAADTEPRRCWQWNSYTPIAATNAAIRDGDFKLVRPAMSGITYASDHDAELVSRYVQLDIDYKYQPETITGIFSDMVPVMKVPDPPPPELYNLRDDPQETVDLASSDPARATRMLAELETWFEDVEGERQRRVLTTDWPA